MELAQLHMVKQILETGSLSKTALRLKWTQSAVTRQLAALEREVGGRIFYRNGRAAVLTELGERILPEMDLMISASQNMLRIATQMRTEIAGEVKIAVSPQVLPYLSGQLYTRLKQTHPEIRLSMWEAFADSIRSDVEEGRTDIAVFVRGLNKVKPHDRVICDLEAYLVGLPDSPATEKETIAFSQLAGLPLLLPAPPNAWRRSLEETAARKNMTLTVTAEVNTPGPAAALVHEGAGYFMVPLVLGAAAAQMGWIAADVHAKRLRASRIVDPTFGSKLVVGTVGSRRRRVEIVAQMVEDMLSELTKPKPDNDSHRGASGKALATKKGPAKPAQVFGPVGE